MIYFSNIRSISALAIAVTALMSPLWPGIATAQTTISIGSLKRACFEIQNVYDHKIPTDINASSAWVGVDYSIPNSSFLVQNGNLQNIGQLIAPTDNVANSINANGVIVGSVKQDAQHSFGYILDHGVSTFLTPSVGRIGLNLSNNSDKNLIVGWEEQLVSNVFSQRMLVVRKLADGTYQKTFLNAQSDAFASDINNSGFVAGNLVNTRINNGGIFTPDHTTAILASVDAPNFTQILTPLGTPNVLSTRAIAINEAGTVVGSLQETSGAIFPVAWQNGTMRKLPNLSSANNGTANDIDSLGNIVGYSYIPHPTFPTVMVPAAFLYTSGRVYNLNKLLCSPPTNGYFLTGASAISSKGEIIGIGASLTSPSMSGFRLVPRNLRVQTPSRLGPVQKTGK